MTQEKNGTGSSERVCKVCGQRVVSGREGTFTQWIVGCSCGIPVEESELTEREVFLFCDTCGKKINQARKGSFTQWIFRADSCSCEIPIVREGEREPEKHPGEALSEAESYLADEEAYDDLPELIAEHSGAIRSIAGDRYRPLSVVGRGSMGAVYLCLDRLLQKRVAIKFLRILESEQVVRFQQEARVASRIHHPNVVTVLDFGATVEGVPYLIMEYMGEINLQDVVVENGPMEPVLAVTILCKVVSALGHAHGAGILHRDIKSSNILLKKVKGVLEPYLIDFGVARFTESTTSDKDSEGSEIVGSPYYMAPDMASGLEYDVRSEIYSVGCVLFEALTGKVPFEGQTALETISMHAHDLPPSLEEAAGDGRDNRDVKDVDDAEDPADAKEVLDHAEFTEELEALVARCLKKDPADRYQTMAELEEDLLRLPLVSRDADVVSWTPERKRIVAMSLVAVFSIALLASAAVIYYFMSLAAREPEVHGAGPRQTAAFNKRKSKKEKVDLVKMLEGENEFTVSPVKEHQSADEYYHEALSFRNLGFPNEARLAMKKAAAAGDPVVKKRAEIFIKAHLPRIIVPTDAVYENIDAYTMMSSVLPAESDQFDPQPQLRARRKAQEAEIMWKEMTRKYPDFEWPYYDLGILYYRTGRIDESEAMYKKTLELNPSYYDAWVSLAVIDFKKGRTEEARVKLKKALELDPEHPLAHSVKARFDDDDLNKHR